MTIRPRILSLLALILCLQQAGHAAEWPRDFNFTIELSKDKIRPGESISILAQGTRHHRGQLRTNTEEMQTRAVRFFILPLRYNAFLDTPRPIPAEKVSPTEYRIPFPASIRPDWYFLFAQVSDGNGAFDDTDQVAVHRDRELANVVLAIANPGSDPQIRVHTERMRSVFSLGEEIRFFASGRAPGAVNVPVTLRLRPPPQNARVVAPIELGRVTLQAAAGQTATQGLDLPAAASKAIAPGVYALEAVVGDDVADRYLVEFVDPRPASGGGRWAHNQQAFGNSPGFDASRSNPFKLDSRRYKGMADNVVGDQHKASLWVNFYSNSHPLAGPDPYDLPHADAPDMPPAGAAFRPSLTHAFYEHFMRNGTAIGITLGYGEDYRAEVYMPVPGTVQEDMDILARKYLVGSLGAQQFPHFVSVYTDYYGHLDWHGGGELSSEDNRRVQEAIWEQAARKAGIDPTNRPLRYRMPNRLREMDDQYRNLVQRMDKTYAEFFENVNPQDYGSEGGRNWRDNLTGEMTLKLWTDLWAALGVSPPPPGQPYTPHPDQLPEPILTKYGQDANYKYSSHMLRGIERMYGLLTDRIAEELPAVFSFHNRLGMNHAAVSHAWTGFRTPNIDPAYARGATAIDVSEWNLDGVPKPFFLSTFYNRTLQDEGRAVYRCGLWGQAGMTTRFMRDAVLWAGRQVHVYFDDVDNLTWSHKGVDQTTYASRDRIRAVSDFLSHYTDLFNQLEPVREVGYYIPPHGDAWGNALIHGHTIGMLLPLLGDHQVHMVSHGDIERDGLRQYPILYAASMHAEHIFPFEKEAFQAYIDGGGHIVGAPMPNYYHPEEVYADTNISFERVPDIDPNTGEPRTNRDGSIRTRVVWTETMEEWATVTRRYVWGFLDRNVDIAPVDLLTTYTHRVNGEPATHGGSHWTHHHRWNLYRAPAQDQYKKLQPLFDAVLEPFVRKSEPWVFTNVNKPRDPEAQGYFLFASNWKFPDHPDFHTLRVPQQFFNSGVAPTTTTLKVKAEGIGAIYDIIEGKAVEFTREGDRLVFPCDLTSVEGRIFALYPEPVASAVLEVPDTVDGGSLLQGRFVLRGAEGAPLSVLGSVRVRLMLGTQTLADLNRALPADGRLPALPVPANAAAPLTLRVTDTITGFEATATIPVNAKPLPTTPAAAVTVFRGDRIHEWLKENSGSIRVVTAPTELQWDDKKGKTKGDANPDAAKEQAAANQMTQALGSAGVRASVTTNFDAVDTRLYAHPWSGRMAGARTRYVGITHHIDGPVLLVGSPKSNPYLRQMERMYLAPRALQEGNLAPGRAVVAWAPGMFSPNTATVIVAAYDEAGYRAAAEMLASLAQANPGADPFYEARERVRFSWTPSEIVHFKESQGLAPTPFPNPVRQGAEQTITAERTWSGLYARLGTPIVNMNASAGGVAIGTKSWVRPFGMLDPEGNILGFWGGGNEITPRDVGISPDGKTGLAAFNLLGVTAAYRPGEGQLWKREMGVIHHGNPYSWDSYKESERGLGTSPDNRLFVINAGTEGVLGIEATTGEIRWRVQNDPTHDRPRGTPTPEFGFSHDGSRVLMRVQRRLPDVKVRYTVKYRDIDPDSGRFKHEREAYDKEVEVDAIPYLEEVLLVDAETGNPVWRRTTGYSLFQRVTPDDIRRIWQAGRDGPVYFAQNAEGNVGDFKPAGEEEVPRLAATGASAFDVEKDPILSIPFWHLYSYVGPEGAWSILATRSPDFVLLDAKGDELRAFEAKDMPRELNPGREIPPRVLTSRDPKTILMFAAERERAFVYNIHIGTPAQIELAKERTARRQRIADQLRRGWSAGRREYQSWDSKERRDAILDPIGLPDDLRAMADNIMSRMPAEHRAGRRRDFGWMRNTYNDILNALYHQDLEIMDAASNLVLRNTIDLPAMICEGEANESMTVFYVGLWDGTVRAYETATGKELWSTRVVGGSQIALEKDEGGRTTAVYAGGSRGDLFKLNPEDGSVIWHRNITRPTNTF